MLTCDDCGKDFPDQQVVDGLCGGCEDLRDERERQKLVADHPPLKPHETIYVQPRCGLAFCPQGEGSEGPYWCGDDVGCEECGRGGHRYDLHEEQSDE